MRLKRNFNIAFLLSAGPEFASGYVGFFSYIW